MKVKRLEVYKDGGTVLITTDAGIYYIDNRLDSKTKKELYFVYPDKGDAILEPDSSKIKKQLYDALATYADNFYSESHIEMIRKDLSK